MTYAISRAVFHRLNPLAYLPVFACPPARNADVRPAAGSVSRTLADRLQPAAHSAEEASDERLFERFRDAADEGAFGMLVHRYEEELFGFLNRYLGDAQAAEDTFQTTFLRVYQDRAAFQAGRTFRPWLYTIATNQALDLQRRTSGPTEPAGQARMPRTTFPWTSVSR
jgi:hypothetical protein